MMSKVFTRVFFRVLRARACFLFLPKEWMAALRSVVILKHAVDPG
jgi:hypothetical protein